MSSAAVTTRRLWRALHSVVGGRLVEGPAHSARGYSASIRWSYDEWRPQLLAIQFPAVNWPVGTAIGWRLRTRAKVTIDSPDRGLTRRSDLWGTMGDAHSPASILGTMLSFGAQVAAVETYGGTVRWVEAHVVSPPRGKQVVNWRIV